MKHLISLLFLMLSFVVFSFTAQAEVGEVVTIEKAIEARVNQLVHQVDPEAQVNVKLKLRSVDLNLPGTSFDYFGVTSIKTIQVEDIENVDVQILSTMDPLPDWVVKLVQKNVEFSGVKVNVKAEPFSTEMLDQIYAHQPGKRLMRWFANSIGGLLPYGVGLIALIVGLGATIFAWFFFLVPKFLREQIGRLVEAIESQSGEEEIKPLEQVQDVQEDAGVSAAQQEELKGSLNLPDEGLIELIADCYWTNEDTYAKWIWDNLHPEQRQSLMNLWEPLAGYAKHLQTCKSAPKSHHFHPYYLRPLTLKSFDQKSVETLTTKDMSVWNMLSPLRQTSLSVPLEKKIKMLEAPIKPQDQIQLPAQASEPRSFEVAANFGELSLDDEKVLWKNNQLIPVKLRMNVLSLVWVAKLEKTDRTDLLARITASELASSWVGPEEALAKLKEVVPEKKWKLVDSYLKNITPSRKTDAFRRMSQAAVQVMNEKQDSKSEIRKVS